MVLIFLLYALCASSFTMCKAVLQYSKPIFFIGIRMVVAGLILLALYYWRTGKKPKLDPGAFWLFMQIIMFHIYFAYVFDLWSLQYLTSFKSSFFFNLSPFFTALLSYFHFGERMTGQKWLGLAIGCSGFLPELMHHQSAENAVGGILFISWPELVMMGAVLSACYGWILMRKLVRFGEYSPLMVNGIGMMGGGILALITSIIVEGWVVSPVTDVPPFIALTAAIIVVVNLIFYNLYGFLLKSYTATFLSFAGFTCPLFAALFGVIFLKEQVTWTFFFSSAVVACGLYLFYQEELKQGYLIQENIS